MRVYNQKKFIHWAICIFVKLNVVLKIFSENRS